MANLTNAYELELLDGLVGETALTTPTTVYVALFTADPTDTGSVANELTGNGYARKSLATTFGSAASGTTSNTSAVTFATATADWSAVTHVGLMKSGTAATADMMVWIALSSSITILNGQAFEFAIGDLTINAD